MNREERRRAQRGRRGDQIPAGDQETRLVDGRWVAPAGRLQEVRGVPDSRREAERQDFLAGTIFAAGAALLNPESAPGEPPLPPVFAVILADGPDTFGVCPRLRDLFGMLDQVGFVGLHEQVRVAASWAMMAGDPADSPLVKLKLDFIQPLRASARVLLLADRYPAYWQYIADGGLVGLTTMGRLQRAGQRPNPTFADGLSACIPVGLATSPGLRRLIDMYGWPADRLG